MNPLDVTLIVPFLTVDHDMREAIDTLLSPPPEGLARCLRKADRLPRTSDATEIQTLFGLPDETAPAALSYLADTGRATEGFCLRADPVFLDLGRRGLLMGPPPGPIDSEVLETLDRLLAPIFEGTGMHLEILAEGRGYLHRPAPPPGVRFSHRPPVAGEDITPLMPEGDTARDWRRLLNECQTRLHRPAFATDANRQNINSLFLWGGGGLPVRRQATEGPCTWSDDPVLRGAARLTGVPERCLPRDADKWLDAIGGEAGQHLLHLQGLERPARVREHEDWARTLAGLDERWIAPLVTAVGEGRITRLTLLTDGAGWTLRRPNLRRWWRRRRFVDLLPERQR